MHVKQINRRQMLTGAGLSGARGAVQAQSTTVMPTVAHSAQAAFLTHLHTHFPGAIQQVNLHAVQALSAVVVNAHTKGIKALAIRWTVQTPSGVHSELVCHYMPAYMARDGSKSVGVARRLLVPKGRAVLLTPATVLTSNSYARGYRPNLQKSLQKNLRRQFYSVLATAVPASAVTASVEGIYYRDGTVSGPEGSYLHRQVRLVQNAEHDQALSVIRAVREAAPNVVPKKLSKRRFQRLTHTGSVLKRDYQYARKQQARHFVKLLRKNGKPAMVEHLTKLLRYPKINPGPETKA